MRKKVRSLFTIVFLSTLLFINPNISLCQKKEEEKSGKSKKAEEYYRRDGTFEAFRGVTDVIIDGLISGIEEVTQGGIPYPIYRGYLESDEEDFIKKPKKIIEFYIDHLLIKPTETILYETSTKIKTDIGKTVSYSYSIDADDKAKIKIELTALIIENKGIEIKIKIFQGRKIIKEEIVFTKNLEPIVVELLENKDKQEKFADKIVPLIRTINPAIRYPYVIEELKFLNYMLFMNRELVKRRTTYEDLTVPGGSKDKPIFVGFFIEGKGMYVMSFSPFEGAEPIGVARDNIMKFKDKGDLFEFVSLRPIMPEGKWLVWVRINPFYDAVNDPVISEDHREHLKSRYQKDNPYVSFWFSGREIMERVFGKKKKTKEEAS